MMDNGLIVLATIGGLIIMFILWLFIALPSTSSSKQEFIASKFKRISEVEGIVQVNGMDLKTFDFGILELDSKVSIRLHSDMKGSVIIKDITLYEQSLFAYAPVELTYREKADYAIQTLKHSAHQGMILMSLAHKTEEILLQVDEQNTYIEQGKLKKLRNDDFVWCS